MMGVMVSLHSFFYILKPNQMKKIIFVIVGVILGTILDDPQEEVVKKQNVPAGHYKDFYNKGLKKWSKLSSDDFEYIVKSDDSAAFLFKKQNNKVLRLNLVKIDFKDDVGIIADYTTINGDSATVTVTLLGEKRYNVTLEGVGQKISFEAKEGSVLN